MKRAWNKIQQDKRDYLVSYFSFADNAYTGTITMFGSFDDVTNKAIEHLGDSEYFTLYDSTTGRTFDATDYVTF